MEGFLGKWKLESSEHFESYMKEVGVSMVTRKAAAALKPSTTYIAEPDGFYVIRSESSMGTHDTRFRLNEEFDEKTQDGRKCKSIIRLEGKKLIQDQKGEVPSTLIRELEDDSTLVLTLTANAVKCTRVYKRA